MIPLNHTFLWGPRLRLLFNTWFLGLAVAESTIQTAYRSAWAFLYRSHGCDQQTDTQTHRQRYICNKAVIDLRLRPRCFHLESYFQQTSFPCCYIRRDTACKHDVINIQHAHCGLAGSDCKKQSQASAACNEYSYAPSPRLRVTLSA